MEYVRLGACRLGEMVIDDNETCLEIERAAPTIHSPHAVISVMNIVLVLVIDRLGAEDT